ncbi:MAG: 1-acyl-sn-glycerol-3-phosphate acyltransferase [Bacteroidales bacterium]|nr:1-acyl-sn-glycerol-3-phosphate acyltransferase [Bacteroidales bacterium]
MEINDTEFEDIRPYRDNEVPAAIERLLAEPGFRKTIKYFFPNVPYEVTEQTLRGIKTVKEFQHKFIVTLVTGLEKKTTCGVTINGLENIEEGKGYILMSNHRDIILDSAFLNTHLALMGKETSEIAIGSNLLIFPWITDLVKLNRTFVVKRNLSVKELMVSSMIQSKYIRNTIINRNTSIWIAQREGRTKNGDDKTQGSVLKMFNMCESGDVVQNLIPLNIIPVTFSYEYDPVDTYKVAEAYNKMVDSSFKKSKSDDVAGMREGMAWKKGRVTINVGKPINDDLANMPKAPNKNAQYDEIAKLIDKKIYAGYTLYPINYVAADILSGQTRFANMYTDADKAAALGYFDEQCKRFQGDVDIQRQMLMKIYANPVYNAMDIQQ